MTIASIDPAKIPASQDALIAGALTQFSRRLAALEATAGRIGANTIRGDNYISNNSITAAQIRAGSITADRLNVSSLDAITATLGNIVSGNITLNAGSWIRTAPIGGSVAYTEFSPAGIRAQNSAGVETFNLSASTGILTATAVLQTGSTVPGGTITTGSLDLSKLASDLATSISTNYVTAFSDMARWTNNASGVGATYSVVNVPDALSGGTVLRMNGYESFVHNDKIPFDPTVLYRIRARVRQVTEPTSGAKNFLIGLQGFDESGVAVTNNWVAANFFQAAAGSGWTTLTGYIRGTGTRFQPANDASLPTPIAATVKFLSPAIIGNYLNGNGIAEFDYLAVDVIEIPSNSITSSKLYAGSVEADRIQAANIAAGAITAAKISATIAGGNLLSTATTGFEQDISGWTTSDSPLQYINSGAVLSQSSAFAYYGSKSMFVDTSAAYGTQGVAARSITGPWRTGQTYTASAYVYNPSAATIGMRFTFGDDAAGADVANDDTQTVPANSWKRLILKWSPTADRALAKVGIANLVAGVDFYVDAVQIEHGDIPTAWRPYVSPVVIEGSRITAADFRTNLSPTRLQIDDTVGVASYVGGVITSQLKPGAGGLDIQAHTAAGTASPTERTIRWLSGANNVGVFEARRDASSSAVWLDAYRAAAASNTYLGITAHNGNTPSGSNYASLEVAAENGVYTIYGSAGTRAITVINSNGVSSFPQWTSDRDAKINYGFQGANFGGTNIAETTVTHGLGRTPSMVLVSIRDGQSVYYSAAAVGSKNWNANTFVATAQLFSGTSVGAVNLCWVAIG